MQAPLKTISFFSSLLLRVGSVQLPLVAPLAFAPPRVVSLSSLIADRLIVHAQTTPFLVQYCSYKVAQWRGSRCLARCEGASARLGASWALASLAAHCCYIAELGLERGFASLFSPLPQPLSFPLMLKCSVVKK